MANDTFSDVHYVFFSVLKSISLFLLVIWTIIANGLVFVVLYQNPKMRTVPNLLVANLAFSDFCLGLVVLPLSGVYTVVGYWIFGKGLCEFWLSLDVLVCTSSIWNLSMVGLDRYWAITSPVAYLNKRNVKSATLMIASVWGISAAISLAPFLGWKQFSNQGNYYATHGDNITHQCSHFLDLPSFTIYSATGSFYIPLTLMFYVYYRIYKAFLDHQIRQNYRHNVLRKHLESTILHDLSHVIPEDGAGNANAEDIESSSSDTSSNDSSSSNQKVWEPESPEADFSTAPAILQTELTPLAVHHGRINCYTDEGQGKQMNGSQPNLTSWAIVNHKPSDPGKFTPLPNKVIANLPQIFSNKSCSVGDLHSNCDKSVPVDSSKEEPIDTKCSEHAPLIPKAGKPDLSITPTIQADSCMIIQNPMHSINRDLLQYDSKGGIDLSTKHSSRKVNRSLMPSVEPTPVAVAAANSVASHKENLETKTHHDIPASPAAHHSVEPAVTKAPPVKPENHSQESVVYQPGILIPLARSNRAAQGSIKSQGSLQKVTKNDSTRRNGTTGPHKPNKPKAISAAKEKRGVKVLGIILGCFTLCWLPFFIMYFIVAFCKHCTVNLHAEQFITWLGYANSAMNPIIYTVFNRDYQSALRRLLNRKNNKLMPIIR